MSKGNKAGETFPEKSVWMVNVNQKCLKKILFFPQLEDFCFTDFKSLWEINLVHLNY